MITQVDQDRLAAMVENCATASLSGGVAAYRLKNNKPVSYEDRWDADAYHDARRAGRAANCVLDYLDALTADLATAQQTAARLTLENERLKDIASQIRVRLDASEPRPRKGGQSVGPMAEDWSMTPMTRRNLRRLLDLIAPSDAENVHLPAALEKKS